MAAKLITLSDGYVSLFSCAPNGVEVDHIVATYMYNIPRQSLLRSVSVYFEVRCPIAVYMSMTRMCFIKNASAPTGSWKPTESDIKARTLEVSQSISEYISATIDACDVNVDLFVKDGCNAHLAGMCRSQAAYWTGLAYASLEDWWQWCNTPNAPAFIKVYQDAVRNALLAEYKNIEDIARRSR